MLVSVRVEDEGELDVVVPFELLRVLQGLLLAELCVTRCALGLDDGSWPAMQHQTVV